MLTAIKFFYRYLSSFQLYLMMMLLIVHVTSYLDTEKNIIKKIPAIIGENENDDWSYILLQMIATNIIYLLIYAISMTGIEFLGKSAIKNANMNCVKKIMNVNLNNITKSDYEHVTVSLTTHTVCVNDAIRNLFIEFPRKMLACIHFIMVINDLSFQIMVYCLISNIIFVIFTSIITEFRRKIAASISELNVDLNIMNSNLANNIQSFKTDDRNQEFIRDANNTIGKLYKYHVSDTSLNSITDIFTGLSGQIMISMEAYGCRPMIMSNTIGIEDVMYGIRASSKFVEKLSGIFEYIGNVMRQYKSFEFFLKIDDVISCENETILTSNLGKIKFATSNNNLTLDISENGLIVKINGKNGTGKTTLLTNLLGVSYKNATSNAQIQTYDVNNLEIYPKSYRTQIAYAQQIVPLTRDTIKSYIDAVTKQHNSIDTLLTSVNKYFEFNICAYTDIDIFFKNIDVNTMVRDLSGGQAKFLQIISSVAKLYTQRCNVLILDEPTNNLDSIKVKCIRSIITACVNKGIIVVCITHDDNFISELDHVIVDLSTK